MQKLFVICYVRISSETRVSLLIKIYKFSLQPVYNIYDTSKPLGRMLKFSEEQLDS
jgi:hypothetical protein